jgi:hypothetical protein
LALDQLHNDPTSECNKGTLSLTVSESLCSVGPRLAATPTTSSIKQGSEEVKSKEKMWPVQIKREHDLAKAVKSDDTEVPLHKWDEAICGEPPSKKQQKVVQVMRKFMLHVYCQWLLRDIHGFLAARH